MLERRAIPRLAADVARGYTVVAFAIVVYFGYILLLSLLVDDITLDALTASALLVLWSLVALGSALANWLIFRGATGEQLMSWLVATTPTTTWRTVLWSINGGGAISWAITGSGVAIGAVVFLSQREQYRTDPVVVVPAVVAIGSSILMIISAYALRYARGDAQERGLEFASTPQPRFVDYFYLAVQVSTTFSASDVTVTTSRMRRAIAVHSLIAFAFNTVIVALLVSLLISSVS